MLTALFVKVLPIVIDRAPWAVELIVGGAVKAVVGEKAKSLLKTRAAKNAFAAALRRAFARFAKEFPNVSSSFFDDHFLRHAVADELKRFLTRDETPDPTRMAKAYEHQFGATAGSPNAEVTQAAVRLIGLIEEECKKEKDLTDLLNSRQTDEGIRILRGLDRTSGVDPTPMATVTEADAARAFQVASQELLAWPRTLDGGQWLDRPELSQILEGIEQTASSVSLLLGEPGAGKSALLSRLGHEGSTRGWGVLAIKADQLPEDISSLKDLANHWELPGSLLDCLASLVKERKVLLLIDQLDALSELIDLRTNRLTVLLRLINQTKGLPGVHIVTSCRTFERSYDRRLNTIDAAEMQLSLPAWKDIEPLLKEKGLSPDWPASFKEILRVPQCLNLFLRHFAGSGEVRVFGSYQEMLDELWTARLFAASEHRGAGDLAYDVATEMADRETLTVPVARFDDRRSQLDYLISAGILQYDTTHARVTFTHQTIFDFVRARAFVAREQSLSRYVIERQSGLFVRPKLWSALLYLRRADPAAYRRELELIWNATLLRSHIKTLLIDFLGLQEQPLAFEIGILRPVFSDTAFVANAFAAIAGRQAWFEAIGSDVLSDAMRGSRDAAWPVVNVLSQAWPFARPRVLNLIRDIWLPDAHKHTHAWHALRGLAQWDEEAVGVPIAILERTEMDNYAVQDLASVASISAPNLAPRLIGAQLRKQVTKAKGALSPEPQLPDDATVVEHVSALARENPLKRLLEGHTEWYEISGIAESAPKAYLVDVWPPIQEAIEALSRDDSSPRKAYRSDWLLATAFEIDEGSRRDHEFPLLDSFVFAVRACARTDPKGFKDFVTATSASDVMACHRLIALGLCELAATDPAYALGYLLGDERRLALGPYREHQRETKMLLRSLIPNLTSDDCERVEDAILKAAPYKDVMAEKDPKDRLQYAKWTRQFRLRLLGSFPAEMLTSRTRDFIKSELRAFPEFKDKRDDITLWTASSPLSADKMVDATDETIESFLRAYPDATEWGDAFKRDGGSIEASRAFGAFAKKQPARAIAIAKDLDPKAIQRPAAYAIRELTRDELPDEQLYALVVELDQKGFTGEEFRDCASAALRKRIEKQGTGLPDPIIVLLERWLDEYEVDAATDEPQNAQQPEKDHDRSESLLWGLGGSYTVPSGSYPILEAFFFGLIARQVVPCDRLLSALEKHVNRRDRIEVWNALAHGALRYLGRCERPRAEAFVSRLFDANPGLLVRKSGLLLIAHCLNWASAEVTRRWIELVGNATANRSAQAYGELLVLRKVILNDDSWSQGQIDGLLQRNATASSKESEILCGFMHGAAHLWKDASDRQLLARILAVGMDSADEHVAKAAIDWFRLLSDVELGSDTRPILEAFARGRSVEMAGSQSYALDRLSDLVDTAPELIYDIARRIIDIHKKNIGNLATSVAIDSETLISISLTLQRHPEPHRTKGLELFESLLQYNAYKVRDVLMDIDRRPGVSAPVAQLRRRRRSRQSAK